MPNKLYNSHISERIRYFHGLRILVGGTKQVENEKRHQEIDTDVFRSNWNSMIWLELQVSLHYNLHDAWNKNLFCTGISVHGLSLLV